MDQSVDFRAIELPEHVQVIQPVSLAEVMATVEEQTARGDTARYRPLPIGFQPLDAVVGGGLRPGELLVIGGPSGVGKTIFGLQAARNVVHHDDKTAALYICYEHDRTHLLSRLLCLESREQGGLDAGLTLVKLNGLAVQANDSGGVLSRLRRERRYAPAVEAVERYAARLQIVKASGLNSTLAQISNWAWSLSRTSKNALMVVDYLQKIPVESRALQPETEVTAYLTQGLKELAMETGLRIIAIAAADRAGLKSKRMRFSDLRGSSAIQYEADIGLIMNNKYAIISREHMIYNPQQAGTLRNWIVLTVEKNRAGQAAVDMEYQLDAAHFRLISQGGFVHEHLIDDRITLA